MIPTAQIYAIWASLLASSLDLFADPADVPTLHLAKNPFNPSAATVIADIEEADFDGYDDIPGGSGVQQSFIDPTTGQRIVQIKEPAGGWHFQATGMTNLPQTVYGYYLTDQAGTNLLASARLGANVQIAGIGDGLDIDQVRFRIAANPLS